MPKRPHKTMTPEEYAAMPIIGWHEVCRDVDGCGGVGIRYVTGDIYDPDGDVPSELQEEAELLEAQKKVKFN